MDAMKKSAVLLYVSGCTTGVDAYLARMPAVRLGRGGHGVSATMHIEANTPEEALAAVRTGTVWQGNMAHHFAPVTLVEELARLFDAHRATSGSVEIKHAVSMKVKGVHLRKFPETSAAEVSDLVGSPATEVGWNTWRI